MNHRNQQIIHWYRYGSSPQTVQELIDTNERRTQERDFDILNALLRYNYMTAHQISRTLEAPLRSIQRRMVQLYKMGLMERARFAYQQDPYPKIQPDGSLNTGYRPISEWVYVLSQLGMDYLEWGEEPLAKEWASAWRPKSIGSSRKLSLDHELSRNDACLSIIEEGARRNRYIIDWMGSRESYARIPASPNGGAGAIEPDAILLLDTGRPLFVEYERSGRTTRFHSKARNLRRYFLGGYWKDQFVLEPWVIYAVSDDNNRTQNTASGSYQGLANTAKLFGARRYLLLNENAWRDGRWSALNSEGRLVDFWDTVWGGDGISRTTSS